MAATLAVVGAMAYGRAPDPATTHGPNPHETFYQYVALELDAPALCEKVSRSAVIPGGFFIAPSYARSDCYANLARRFDKPSLCLHARRLGAFAVLSQQTSPLTCFIDVMRRAPDAGVSTEMPARVDVVSIFREMGYRPEELHSEGITPPLLNLSDAYWRLANQPDLVRRIARVTESPVAPAALTSAGRMRLYELAAHVSNDAAWCSRIPADLLEPGTERKAKGPSLFQRDRCILEIASNLRRPDLCALIPVRPDDWPGPMGRRALCERQAERPPDKFHYGAPKPQTDDEARQLITALGYPLPDVRDVAANQIATGYYDFIWRIADTDKGASSSGTIAAARAKFLSRVAALPSYP